MIIDPKVRIFVTGRTQTGKSHFCKSIVAKTSNFIVYDPKREYGAYGAVVRDLLGLHSAFVGGCHKVVFQPNNLSPEYFDLVCLYIYNNLSNIVFIVDEVHIFCTKHKITPNFKNVITVKQSDGVGVIAITQRPANVHNDVLSQSTIIISFKLNLLADAQAVSDLTDIDISVIRDLPLRHFIYFDDRTGNYTVNDPI